MSVEFLSEVQEFLGLLDQHSEISRLSTETKQKLADFYGLVLQENEIQNLTRLLTPLEFFEGHVLDAWTVEITGFLVHPVLDLGSGVGSPGLIHAILTGKDWVLCDSELNKAAFLSRAVAHLGLKRVIVAHQRAESYLDSHKIGSITAKAVGKVGKLFGWLSACSTWNKLILFKGPGWDEEWSEFMKTPAKKRLKVLDIYEYTIGTPAKARKIVLLSR